MPTFPMFNVISLASVGDDGPGADITLAVAVGVEPEVYADPDGVTPVQVFDRFGAPTTLQVNSKGWGPLFKTFDEVTVWLKFGDLDPMPHYSVELSNAVPEAQAARQVAEAARTQATQAALAAEAAQAAVEDILAPVDAQVDEGITRAISNNVIAPSTAAGAVDGHVLTWDAGASKFVPEAPTGGGGSASASVMSVPVVWNGTVWKIGDTTVTSEAEAQAAAPLAAEGSMLIFVTPSGVTPAAWAPVGTGYFGRSGWMRA